MSLNEFHVQGSSPDTPPSFSGLGSLLESAADLAGAAPQRLNVLMVHGIGGYSGRDDVELPRLIGERLALREVRDDGFFKIISDPSGGAEAVGRIRRMVFGGPAGGDPGRTLAVYVLYWSHATRADREKLIEDDRQDWVEQRRLRAYTDGAKQDFLNYRVADAFLYTGKRREVIDYVFFKTLKIIDADSGPHDYRSAVIAFSLGSAIAARGLEGLAYPKEKVVEDFSARTCKLYFMANQIPLLAMGIIDEPDPAKLVYNKLAAEDGRKSLTCPSDGRPWVVSFTDPNDLLSYPISKQAMDDHKNVFADVVVSVATTAYWIPFTSYWVPHPVEAHTGYAGNEKVLDLLLNGYAPAR